MESFNNIKKAALRISIQALSNFFFWVFDISLSSYNFSTSKKIFTENTKTALKPILAIKEKRNCQLKLTSLISVNFQTDVLLTQK